MYRWYLVFFLLTLAALSTIIILDTKPAQEPASNSKDVPARGQADLTYFDFHGGVDINSESEISRRIETIEQTLQEMDGMAEVAIPYYGELMLLYHELGRKDGAAEASRHIAMIVEDAQDWWNAATLFYQWAEEQTSAESRQFYMGRAADCYSQAAKLLGDASLHTDYAIVLLNLGRTDRALEILKESMENKPTYYRSFLYAGMILYQNGKNDESISYINRSIEKAKTEQELQIIHSVVANTSIEI